MQILNQFLGGSGTLLTQKEAWDVVASWRQTFSQGLKDETGYWTIGGVDWHVFSFGYFPSIKGDEAEQAFVPDSSIFVFSSHAEQQDTVLFFENGLSSKPKIVNFLETHREYLDLYFYSKEGKWTMIFTHEQNFDRIFADARRH